METISRIKNNTKSWYAVYTRSRAEKKVLSEFEYMGIEAYLPTQKKLRKWSDRKKWVEVPLISSYVFVNIPLMAYDKVLQTNGVVTYVRFEGKAATIPEEQINYIKCLMHQSELEIEALTKNFKKGDAIEVIGGPLMGIHGTLISMKGKKRVAIQLEQLNLSLVVDLPISEIKKLA